MRVLFVCTGNVFRSMVAEKCLKDYLEKHGIDGISVDSAGTETARQDVLPETRERLEFYGIDSGHRYKQLTKQLVDKSDVIIAMNKNHQDYIKERFGISVPLFDELALGKKEGVPDFDEKYPDIRTRKDWAEIVRKHAFETVDHIHDAIPGLVKKLRERKS